MRDAFPIVCMLGDRLAREKTWWRDVKALVVIVAQEGDWNGASALAECLGIAPPEQEKIFNEVFTKAGGAIPAPPHLRSQPA